MSLSLFFKSKRCRGSYVLPIGNANPKPVIYLAFLSVILYKKSISLNVSTLNSGGILAEMVPGAVHHHDIHGSPSIGWEKRGSSNPVGEPHQENSFHAGLGPAFRLCLVFPILAGYRRF